MGGGRRPHIICLLDLDLDASHRKRDLLTNYYDYAVTGQFLGKPELSIKNKNNKN